MVMWKGDHADKLTLDQYRYWMLAPLPSGWAILSDPDRKPRRLWQLRGQVSRTSINSIDRVTTH
jgi:hypothetical protein